MGDPLGHHNATTSGFVPVKTSLNQKQVYSLSLENVLMNLRLSFLRRADFSIWGTSFL